MLKSLLATTAIVAAGMFLLSIRIILKRGGRFPNTHIGQNKEMRKRGIGCVEHMDAEQRLPNPHRIAEHTAKNK